MKIKLIALFTFIILSIGAIFYDMNQYPSFILFTNNDFEKIEMPLPNMQGKILNSNQRINLHELKEDTILLNFWASWCGICMVEMDEMFELIQEKKGDVALVTISIDDTEAQANKAYQYFKKRYADSINDPHIYWIWDEDKEISLQAFNITKTPETIIVNKQRQMTEKILGAYDWSGSKIREKLNTLN